MVKFDHGMAKIYEGFAGIRNVSDGNISCREIIFLMFFLFVGTKGMKLDEAVFFSSIRYDFGMLIRVPLLKSPKL